MYPIGAVTDCQVQMVSHRKQGPVLPTLVVNIAPDPAADKLRKRRSSRTAGLTPAKEAAPTTLGFRPGDEQHNLHDWSRCIQAHMQPYMACPMSPITPGSPTFINPFGPPRPREPSDNQQRPTSGNTRAPLTHKTSNQTQSSRERDRERPVTYSESPSLRSRRSDLSHASSMNPSHMGFGMQGGHAAYGYGHHPADLPSPATTIGEYQGEFIEGWTAAQGRAAAVSSPVRGRDSVSSQPPGPPSQQLVNSSSPPAPRETILDRAFQLKCLPGAVREADQRRRAKTTTMTAMPTLKDSAPTSAWDSDDDSDDDSDAGRGGDDDDEARDAYGDQPHHLNDRSVYMPGAAQRALEFITNRHEPNRSSQQAVARSPVNHNADALRALNSGYPSHLLPHTGYSRNRPAIAQRTHSQPHLAAALATVNHNNNNNNNSAATLDVPLSSSSGRTTSDDGSSTSLHRGAGEKRQSTSSAKRLSFTEFTKRLSSTSSLLLVQTNVSAGAGSSRGSSELDIQQSSSTTSTAAAASGKASRHHNPRATPVPAPIDTEKCGWRGSVGVFGAAEGGFL